MQQNNTTKQNHKTPINIKNEYNLLLQNLDTLSNIFYNLRYQISLNNFQKWQTFNTNISADTLLYVVYNHSQNPKFAKKPQDKPQDKETDMTRNIIRIIFSCKAIYIRMTELINCTEIPNLTQDGGRKYQRLFKQFTRLINQIIFAGMINFKQCTDNRFINGIVNIKQELKDIIAGNNKNCTLKIGKTTKQPVIYVNNKDYQQKNMIEQFSVNTLFGIIICILNCKVIQDHIPQNITEIARNTLMQANSDDLEVLDVIHLIEKQLQLFTLAVLSVKNKHNYYNQNNFVENDYNITNIILNALENPDIINKIRQNNNTLEIFIVSESFNLQNDKFNIIFKKIPFHLIKANGIEKIQINIISCNTIENAKNIVLCVDDVINKYDVKVQVNLIDGYVFNNISTLYAPTSYMNHIQSNTDNQKGGDLNTAIFKLEQTEKNMPKIQIVFNGLTIAHNQDCIVSTKILLDNGEYTTKKTFKPTTEKVLQGTMFSYGN